MGSYWYKVRQTDQWNRVQRPAVPMLLYTPVYISVFITNFPSQCFPNGDEILTFEVGRDFQGKKNVLEGPELSISLLRFLQLPLLPLPVSQLCHLGHLFQSLRHDPGIWLRLQLGSLESCHVYELVRIQPNMGDGERENNVNTQASLLFHSVTIKLSSKHQVRNVNLCSSRWFSRVSEYVSILLRLV